MNQQAGAGTMTAAAKKWIMLVMLIAAVGLFLLFIVAKEGPRGVKIIGEGDRAPEFRLPALDGKQVGLADYRGKVVMVHFWATWCPPCVEEIPTLERLYRGLFGKDFALLAVSVDEGGVDAVNSFMQRNRLSLPVLLDPGRSVAGLYGTFKFPETYLIDRNGIVRYKVIGPRDWTVPANVDIIRDIVEGK
jgi:peroxiredoxin